MQTNSMHVVDTVLRLAQDPNFGGLCSFTLPIDTTLRTFIKMCIKGYDEVGLGIKKRQGMAFKLIEATCKETFKAELKTHREKPEEGAPRQRAFHHTLMDLVEIGTRADLDTLKTFYTTEEWQHALGQEYYTSQIGHEMIEVV